MYACLALVAVTIVATSFSVVLEAAAVAAGAAAVALVAARDFASFLVFEPKLVQKERIISNSHADYPGLSYSNR